MTGRTSNVITRRAQRAATDTRGLCVVVITDAAVRSQDLPATGTVVIGRAAESDIMIDEPSVSRRHALLHMGPPVAIEDLESANGTAVRGHTVAAGEQATLRIGEAFQIGLVTAVIQPRSSAGSTVRDHAYFAARLGEACAQWDGASTVAVIVVRFAHPPSPTALELIKSPPVVATYGPETFELLVTTGDADALARRLRDQVGKLGVEATTGVAVCGRDGTEAEALISAAVAGARGADRYRVGELTVVIRSPRMERIYRLTERIAASELSVLVLGETGVGKEILAEAIHRMSPRSALPFLRLNCAALSETLLESELFGHERGAFTGADRAKVGLLESAQGGTVFLDEIGEMPAATQVKLLRVIEERQVLPVGAVRPRAVDLRFVAATNRDLELEVNRGRFRADLFFRLNGFTLVVPPLRERVEEIGDLAEMFMARAAQAGRRPPPGITAEARRWLEEYPWPGNIRELRNVIERAVVLADREPIRIEHFVLEASARRIDPGAPGDAAEPSRSPAAGDAVAPVADSGGTAAMRDALAAAERARILAVLDECAGNQTQAARRLGISRRTLLKRLDAYAVRRPRKGR